MSVAFVEKYWFLNLKNAMSVRRNQLYVETQSSAVFTFQTQAYLREITHTPVKRTTWARRPFQITVLADLISSELGVCFTSIDESCAHMKSGRSCHTTYSP
jgi:hypothetical protein